MPTDTRDRSSTGPESDAPAPETPPYREAPQSREMAGAREPAGHAFFEPLDRDPGISVHDLLTALRRRRSWLLIALAAGIVLSVIAGRILPNSYKITTIVAPAPEAIQPAGSAIESLLGSRSGGGAGAFASLLGGRANTVAPFDLFQRFLTSERLAQRLDQRYGLIREVFAAQWDPNQRQWRRPNTFGSAVVGGVYTLFGLRPWNPPSAEDLARYIDRHLSVSQGERSAMTEISFRHRDPRQALRILNMVIDEADSIVREQERQRLDQQIEYMRTQLALATITAHREVLANLLASLEQRRLMTVPTLKFAVLIVQPPVAPARPTSPNPWVLLAVGIIGGLCVGVGVVCMVELIGKPRPAV